MSMSVRCGGCGLEYAGSRGLGGLFPHAANVTNRRYLRMLGEVLRFHRQAKALLADERRSRPSPTRRRCPSSWPGAGSATTSRCTS